MPPPSTAPDRGSGCRSVTLPLLTPVILFNLVTGVIYSFQVFAQALVIGDTTGRAAGIDADVHGAHLPQRLPLLLDGLRGGAGDVLFAAVALLTLLIFRSARALGPLRGR